MKIIDQEGFYWTEVNPREFPITDKEGNFLRGFWSKFKQQGYEKRDFFVGKAVFLFCLMRLEGVKARLII